MSSPRPDDGPYIGPTSVDPTTVLPPGVAPALKSAPATALGLRAFTANGRIHPRGRPTTYYFEYGPTAAYGSRTPERALSPKLAAFYRESWDVSTAGWRGGLSGLDLDHYQSGGQAGGFVRYAGPGDQDTNHFDGIGVNELVQYMYPGTYDDTGEEVYSAFFGGGSMTDFRGARITGYARGNNWAPKGSECMFWLQSTPDTSTMYDAEASRWTNWAFSGFALTDALLAGGWRKFEYRLLNDSNYWTYAGNYVEAQRDTYLYRPLDEALGDINGDIFHMLVYVDILNVPTGDVDIDEVEIAYRNRSLLLPSNGGRFVSATSSSEDPARLTDGWRNGAGKMWSSGAFPKGPVELLYELERPVTIDKVQIHQNPEWPSDQVELLVSTDGVEFTPLTAGNVPASAAFGPNYAFFLDPSVRATNVKQVKVRILSGVKLEHWGLGEIELFGSGAQMQTEDDWYEVNADIAGLSPGGTMHYRIVATSTDGTTIGEDQVYTAPVTAKPDVLTTPKATRIAPTTATVETRVNPLGLATKYYVEYGLDSTYGTRTEDLYAGLQLTPRTIMAGLDGLERGKTYHYRFVVWNGAGTTTLPDATFTTP